MGKVLIVSDNHGRIDTLKKIIDMEKPVDLVIHCGDSEMTDIIPTLTIVTFLVTYPHVLILNTWGTTY